MVYYGTRLSENISRRDSATSIGAWNRARTA